MRKVVFAIMMLAGGTAFGVDPIVVQQIPRPVVVQAQPQTIWVPRIQYQPYQHQDSKAWEKRYPTPLRNLLFGRWYIEHRYMPRQ